MQHNGFVIDAEADGFVFESTVMWVMVLRDLDDENKIIKLHPFKNKRKAKKEFLTFMRGYDNPKIVFHNGLGYDIFAMLFLMGIEHSVGPDTLEGVDVEFVDTFYLSMFLKPDREKHSIEYFGDILGFPKMDFRQASIEAGVIEARSEEGSEFKQHSPVMDEYCEQDTLVGIKTYYYLINEWVELYGKFSEFIPSYKAGQKAFYLMSCQELTGWKFNTEAAKKLAVRIENMQEQLRGEVEPLLPPRELKKGEQKTYTMPAKPFLKDGGYSSHWNKFVEKHNGVEVGHRKWKFYGKEYNVEANLLLDVKLPMEMANQDQMKDWFLANGWKPTLWNFQRGPDGKPMRDLKTRQLIKTSPKMQEQGKLCTNLEQMEGEIVGKVVKWLSLRNRLSVLQGWLNNPRLEYDGRIGAGRTGIAATHRQKHKVVVNVPKADPKVLLGYEFRELWISEPGMLIAAGDAAALEGRVQGHYCYRYDNGATAEELLKGDVHSKNAVAFYAELNPIVKTLYESENFSKDDPQFKPFRNKSKNGYYAIMYGAAGPKVASTLGIPEKYGQASLDAFWASNPGTKALKENLEKYWESTGKKKYLPAIDGRILVTRKKSALLNTIFQSCGGIVMDYAGCFMDKWLGGLHWDDKRRPYYLYKGRVVRRIGYFHDEMEFECDEGIAEEVAKMIEKSISTAGKFLKLKVPLEGEGKVGVDWKETH